MDRAESDISLCSVARYGRRLWCIVVCSSTRGKSWRPDRSSVRQSTFHRVSCTEPAPRVSSGGPWGTSCLPTPTRCPEDQVKFCHDRALRRSRQRTIPAMEPLRERVIIGLSPCARRFLSGTSGRLPACCSPPTRRSFVTGAAPTSCSPPSRRDPGSRGCSPGRVAPPRRSTGAVSTSREARREPCSATPATPTRSPVRRVRRRRRASARAVARSPSMRIPQDIYLASTGVIGEPLGTEAMRAAVGAGGRKSLGSALSGALAGRGRCHSHDGHVPRRERAGRPGSTVRRCGLPRSPRGAG